MKFSFSLNFVLTVSVAALFFLGSIVGASPLAAPQVSFTVEQYGAVANGQTDSTAAFQAAINAAIQAGKPAEVVLAAGTYYLACPGPVPATTQDFCLKAHGGQNLTIRGQGSGSTHLMIGNPFMGLLLMTGFNGVAVRSFSVDYSELPFTQGTIAKVHSDAATNAIDVDLTAGYPDFNAPQIDMAVRTSFAMIYDSVLPKLKDGVKGYLYGLKAKNISGRRWRVTLDPGDNGVLRSIRAGDRFGLPLRLSYSFVFWGSSNLALTDVTIYTGPGGATIWSANQDSISIDKLRILRKPGTDRLITTAADAMHLSNNSGPLSITNCTIEGMGDDAINIYTQGSTIQSVLSSTQFVLSVDAYNFAANQWLQVVDTNSQVVKSGTGITSYVMNADGKTATVTISPGVSNLAVGDTVYNASLSSPGAYIANNTFNYFRGTFRLRSHGVVFQNNTIQDKVNGEVLIASDIVQANGAILWNEGPSVMSGSGLMGPMLLNNTVNGVQGSAGLMPLLGIGAVVIPKVVVGNNDGVYGDNKGNLYFAGWACLQGQESPLQLHIYAGGTYGTGVYLGTVSANVTRESGIGSACGTTTPAHGFEFILTAEIRQNYAGKTLYTHAIDFSTNAVLNGSGTIVIPQ